jgi:hypothetical protein
LAQRQRTDHLDFRKNVDSGWVSNEVLGSWWIRLSACQGSPENGLRFQHAMYILCLLGREVGFSFGEKLVFCHRLELINV